MPNEIYRQKNRRRRRRSRALSSKHPILNEIPLNNNIRIAMLQIIFQDTRWKLVLVERGKIMFQQSISKFFFFHSFHHVHQIYQCNDVTPSCVDTTRGAQYRFLSAVTRNMALRKSTRSNGSLSLSFEWIFKLIPLRITFSRAILVWHNDPVERFVASMKY